MNSEKLEQDLLFYLQRYLPNDRALEIYSYACLPAGKLFRPKLVWAVLQDLNQDLYQSSKDKIYSNHSLLASAVEMHHTYTLLHDDLPCMDDDKERRGKPCTHIKYGEWQALLTGDGLLNLSYQLLAQIRTNRLSDVLKFFSWSLGPKGLIEGQVMDLSGDMTKNLNLLLTTHKLKTARLISVAIVGSALLSQNRNYSHEKKLWKFANALGILFQILDDLSELSEECLTSHELDVNPWLKFPEEVMPITLKYFEAINNLNSELKLNFTMEIVHEYYQKMNKHLSSNQDQIRRHLSEKSELSMIIQLLN